ncbi:unnamed protein product [Microthlaspi erraticum]|uniref:Myb/SANT-like domain-containing protein n=1 Tax=Microthlaspi erraticum TaxID=1685480 RepID=A0A6D2HJ29_9BRAS|nr:unnamed protein product [Microthlaspi erraticum]
MNSTGISVDPDASMIYASDAWWKEREFNKGFNRKPPEFWDVMVRCLILHDVRSQSQHSSRQRREEIINDDAVDDNNDDGSNSDSGDIPATRVQETQEDEEVYRVIVDEDMDNLNETVPNTTRRGQQREMSNLQANARRQSNSERGVGGSRLSSRTGSRGGRRRQSFETTIKDTIAGYTEFQRQSLQQLRRCF